MIFFLMIINIKDFSFIAFIYFFSIQLKNDKSFFFVLEENWVFADKKLEFLWKFASLTPTITSFTTSGNRVEENVISLSIIIYSLKH